MPSTIRLLPGYRILHTIGNPIEIQFLGKTFYALNHSPIRYYYRYRNSYYLYHYVDKKFFKKYNTSYPTKQNKLAIQTSLNDLILRLECLFLSFLTFLSDSFQKESF